MLTWSYKGWYVHETFLSDDIRPRTVENGIWVSAPHEGRIRVKSVHAAKCLISRRQKTHIGRSYGFGY